MERSLRAVPYPVIVRGIRSSAYSASYICTLNISKRLWWKDFEVPPERIQITVPEELGTVQVLTPGTSCIVIILCLVAAATTTTRLLATFAPDLGHVFTITTHRFATLTPGFAGFVGGKFMSSTFCMGSPPPFAGDLTLLILIHRSKATRRLLPLVVTFTLIVSHHRLLHNARHRFVLTGLLYQPK